jgi:hypothetical protein
VDVDRERNKARDRLINACGETLTFISFHRLQIARDEYTISSGKCAIHHYKIIVVNYKMFALSFYLITAAVSFLSILYSVVREYQREGLAVEHVLRILQCTRSTNALLPSQPTISFHDPPQRLHLKHASLSFSLSVRQRLLNSLRN